MSVRGSSENDPGWRKATTVSSFMAYPFFGKSASSSTPGYAAFNLHHQDSAIALSEDPNIEYFADGLAEDITTAL
jgi:hypothetical protein